VVAQAGAQCHPHCQPHLQAPPAPPAPLGPPVHACVCVCVCVRVCVCVCQGPPAPSACLGPPAHEYAGTRMHTCMSNHTQLIVHSLCILTCVPASPASAPAPAPLAPACCLSVSDAACATCAPVRRSPSWIVPLVCSPTTRLPRGMAIPACECV